MLKGNARNIAEPIKAPDPISKECTVYCTRRAETVGAGDSSALAIGVT